MIATLSADCRTVSMRHGDWALTIPASDVPRWLAFYRGLWARGSKAPNLPGPYARHFESSVKALERVEKMIKVMGAKG